MSHIALDSLAGLMKLPAKEPEEKPRSRATFDSVDAEAEEDARQLAKKGINAFLSLAELTEDDLEEGEGYGDRLLNLFVGILDSDKDGDLSDDESDMIDIMRSAVGEYLSSAGCDESDISAMLDDFDNDATERCVSAASEGLEEGEDATMDSVRSFVYGSLDCAMKPVTMDATYVKRLSLVGGKKKWVKKRVSGTVRLTGKQKAHLKKLAAKPRSGKTLLKMQKALKKQASMGLMGK